jgi:hypothetical protein
MAIAAAAPRCTIVLSSVQETDLNGVSNKSKKRGQSARVTRNPRPYRRHFGEVPLPRRNAYRQFAASSW